MEPSIPSQSRYHIGLSVLRCQYLLKDRGITGDVLAILNLRATVQNLLDEASGEAYYHFNFDHLFRRYLIVYLELTGTYILTLVGDLIPCSL